MAEQWSDARSAAGKVNKWVIVAIISIPTFMEVLDAAIANVALSHIAGGLSISNDEATWVVTSYLVANAAIIPISGWLSDTIGRKRYFLISIALFAISSLLCGMAPNLTFLILARVFQGVGGGGLAPVEQSMIADTFPPQQRGMAFAAFAFVVVCGPVFGPTLGGVITDNINWHWIFLINVPIGAISFILAQLFVCEPKIMAKERAKRLKGGLRVDLLGFLFVALALGCLEVTLDRGQREDWFSSGLITTTAIFSALGFIGLIIRELSIDDPIVDLRVLANRNFAICCLVMMTGGLIIFGSTQLIPQMLQEVLGYTATDAGLALTAGGVATVLVMPFAGMLTGKVDVRALLGFALLSQGLALLNMTHLDSTISFSDAALARLYQAFALPFLFVPVSAAAYVGLAQSQSNQASALINVARNLGGTFGISTAQTMLERRQQFHQTRLVEGLNGLNPNYNEWINNAGASINGATQAGGASSDTMAGPLGALYQQVQQQATMLSFVDVFHVLMIFVFVVTPLVLLLRPPKPGAAPGPGH
ncbi:MAG: DHA2 family efflux MFS transporter permease subunit [Sphingomonadaceae bacterium]|nr:DHA2 family efflux MFS transporter permease subunit [Sphingomonadaceae bacterium]